jgi:hypothetical protein
MSVAGASASDGPGILALAQNPAALPLSIAAIEKNYYVTGGPQI